MTDDADTERRIDQDPDTGDWVGSEWKPSTRSGYVEQTTRHGMWPRFTTKVEAEAWRDQTGDRSETTAAMIMPNWPPKPRRHLITIQVFVDGEAVIAENVACRAADYITESFDEADNASIQTVLVHLGPFRSTEDGLVHGAQQFNGEDDA